MNEKTRPLETNRLLLCEIKEEDTSLIVQWRSQPDVYRYFFFPRPLTREEHRKWLFNSYIKDKNRIDFIATEKDTDTPIGLFNIKRNEEYAKCSEIGYLLEKSAQGKGYAQEGVERIMAFAKDEWKCEEIIFRIHEENSASRTLAHRLGYTECRREGRFVVYHVGLLNISWGGGYRVKLHTPDTDQFQVAA